MAVMRDREAPDPTRVEKLRVDFRRAMITEVRQRSEEMAGVLEETRWIGPAPQGETMVLEVVVESATHFEELYQAKWVVSKIASAIHVFTFGSATRVLLRCPELEEDGEAEAEAWIDSVIRDALAPEEPEASGEGEASTESSAAGGEPGDASPDQGQEDTDAARG